MDHSHHQHHDGTGAPAVSLNWVAFAATVHCLTGCAVGEIPRMDIGTATGLDNRSTIPLAVLLAFD